MLDFDYRESQQWISGQNPQQEPAFLGGRSAVVWAREYSTEDARRCDCNALQEALGKIPGSKRMVKWLSNLPQAHKLLHTFSCTQTPAHNLLHTHLSSSNLQQYCRTKLHMSACLAPLHLALHLAICGLHIGLTCGGMTHVVLAAPSCSFGYCSAQIRPSSSAQVVWPKPAWHSADRLHIPLVTPCSAETRSVKLLPHVPGSSWAGKRYYYIIIITIFNIIIITIIIIIVYYYYEEDLHVGA